MNTIKKFINLSLFFSLLVSSLSFAGSQHLTPPWYLLQTELAASLQADPCVTVNALQGEGLNMFVDVHVCEQKKAEALAAFISKNHQFNEQLAVRVSVLYDGIAVEGQLPDALEEQVTLLNTALNGNTFFVYARTGLSPTSKVSAFAVFKPLVIQYFSDDISDWYLNTNVVAATLFSKLFDLNPTTDSATPIFATTQVQRKV